MNLNKPISYTGWIIKKDLIRKWKDSGLLDGLYWAGIDPAIDDWPSVLPIARRMFPQLVANDIITVQPMDEPIFINLDDITMEVTYDYNPDLFAVESVKPKSCILPIKKPVSFSIWKFLKNNPQIKELRLGVKSFDPGYIWAPYIPIMVTPSIVDENVFEPRNLITTRYATTTTINSDFYENVRF